MSCIARQVLYNQHHLGTYFFFKSVWQSLPFSLFTVNVVIDLVSIRLSLVLFALVLSFVLWFLSSCFVLY